MSDSQQTSDTIQLWQAIVRKDKETTRQLVQNLNVNVNNPNEIGNTALHLAIINFNDLDIITMLLDKGANICALNYHDDTPLDVAILNNNTEAALLLIEREALLGENINSLLLIVIERNNDIIAKKLVDYGVQSKPSIDLKTLLNTAISEGNSKIIEYILPHCQSLEPSDKYIPKETVINSDLRHNDCVELLLKWNFTISPDSHQDGEFIYAAVEKGYLQIVLQLLELGIDANMEDSNTGLNLLTVACLNKHHEIVENLLKHGANVNVKIPAKDWKLIKPSYFYTNLKSYNELFPPDHQNQLSDITYLHIAVLNSDLMMLKVLLKYNPTIDNEMAFKLTCIAAHYSCDDIVRLFLDRGVDVTNTDSEGRSLLHYCVYWTSNSGNNDSRFNIAQLLLEKAAQINIQNSDKKFVFETIRGENRKRHPESRDLRVDLHHFCTSDDSLLHQAIRNKFDTKFITTLLNYQFSVHAKNAYAHTPLHIACKVKSDHQLEIIEVLLQHNANIECASLFGMTPLHIASYHQNLEVVKLLLKKGANPNAVNKSGKTALHIVCKITASEEQQADRTESLIQLLLQHNANIEAVDSSNITPLTTAYVFDNEVAVKCLLENHTKDDFIYSQNSAPIFWTVGYQCIESIKNFIKYGADINILDEWKRTPFQRQVDQKDNYYYDEIIKVFKTQVVKLKVAGLNVIDQNLNLVYKSNGIEDYPEINILQLEEKCQQEIEKMKIKCIDNNKITFYDLLKKSITILSRLDGIKEVQKALELKVYDKEFPLYINIVRSKVREAQIRHYLMHSAREYFYVNVCHYLPCECIDLILNYLKIKDLIMFIKAMKPSNN